MEPKQLLSATEVKRSMQLKGEVRGVVFKTDFEYILNREGKEGMEKLEDKFREIGRPIRYAEINALDFYPIGLRVISLLAIKDIFGFSDEEIKKIGQAAPKFSLIIKLFTKYFLSITLTARQAPAMWERHYRAGQLTIVEINEKERRIILRLRDFNLHPILCKYLEGYFSTVVQMTVGRSTNSREIKCPFSGGESHEYLVTW
ncbi:MAG: hypothetical protein HY577_02595 [Candidatus Nealsonbacteria bacterium]|nr:hypothetical protein [Candidatus Nealsonbacteria bacterium]